MFLDLMHHMRCYFDLEISTQEDAVFTLNMRTDKNNFFFLFEHLIWKKYNFLVSEYLRTPKNYQSLRIFTGIYAVTFPYIRIGVKINSLFNDALFYQLEYM